MPKVIEIRDGVAELMLDVWADLTEAEAEAVVGVDVASRTKRSRSARMTVLYDPRWTKEFVIGALTQAANAKAAQE